VDLSGDPEGSLKALEKIRQAAPDLYVIASNYHADGETVIASVRAGCSDFIIQPVKRLEFREAMARLERTPRRSAVAGGSRLGKVYTFLGTKGGAGATTLAVNFAGVLAQRKQQTVLVDLDFTANDCAMQAGCAPQHSLQEVGENLSRMDPALFEGLAIRDPLGFFLIGPPDQAEHRVAFTEPLFREFASFLVEKYEAVVIDAGRWITDDIVLAALQSSTAIFLVITQQFPAIRNAQRYIAALMRLGFNQDQLKIVVNFYQKKPAAGVATLDQMRQTLNQPVFYGVPASPAAPAAVNRGRPFVEDGAAAGELDRAFRSFVDKATVAKADADTA
jgi:pilus assembly protein CpaE